MPPPRFYAPQDEAAPHPDLHELQGSPSLSIPSSPDQKEMERNTVSAASELFIRDQWRWTQSDPKENMLICKTGHWTCFVLCLYPFPQDILNHILTDMETFMGKVSAAANAPPPQVKKSKKKKLFKMKKSKKNGNAVVLFHFIFRTCN